MRARVLVVVLVIALGFAAAWLAKDESGFDREDSLEARDSLIDPVVVAPISPRPETANPESGATARRTPDEIEAAAVSIELTFRVEFEDDIGLNEGTTFDLSGEVRSEDAEPIIFRMSSDEPASSAMAPAGFDPAGTYKVCADVTFDFGDVSTEVDYIWPAMSPLRTHNGWELTLSLRVSANDPEDGRWVIGRCLAVDDAPLGRQPISILPPYVETWMDVLLATTREDGRFATYLECWGDGLPATLASGGAWRWTTRHDESEDIPLLSPEWQVTNAPSTDATFINLGDLTWFGALLEISVRDLPQDTTLHAQLKSGDMTREMQAQTTVRIACVPCSYQGVAWWETDDAFPCTRSLTFECSPPAGELTRLELVLPPAQELLVYVRGEDAPLSGAKIDVSWWALDQRFDDEIEASALPLRMELSGVDHVHIWAWASGYESKSVDVPVSQGSVSVELKRERLRVRPSAEAPECAWLEVGAVFPEGMDVSRWYVWLRRPDGSDGENRANHHGNADFEVPVGKWVASLYGGLEFGYRGGLFAGPVEIDLVAGANRYTFTVPLPTQAPCAPRVELRCCGDELWAYGAPALGAEGQALPVGWDLPTDGSYAGMAPVALSPEVGGELKIAPAKYSWYGRSVDCLVAELPERVRVKVQDALDTDTMLRVEVHAEGARNAIHAYTWPGCLAHLWCPPGPAVLEVRDGDVVLARREIHVPRDRILDVEFALDSAPVNFVVRWADAVLLADRGALLDWSLYRFDAGQYVHLADVSDEEEQHLLPGRYFCMPMNTAIGGRCEFEFDARSARTVILEQTKVFERGEVILSLPPGVDSRASDYCISFAPAEWFPLLVDSDAIDDRDERALIQTADGGLRLVNLPAGRPCVVQAWLRTADGHEWMARSFVVTSSATQAPTVGAEWSRLRETDNSWDCDVSLEWRYTGTEWWSFFSDLPQGELEIRVQSRPGLRTVQISVPPGEGRLPAPEAVKQLIEDANR